MPALLQAVAGKLCFSQEVLPCPSGPQTSGRVRLPGWQKFPGSLPQRASLYQPPPWCRGQVFFPSPSAPLSLGFGSPVLAPISGLIYIFKNMSLSSFLCVGGGGRSLSVPASSWWSPNLWELPFSLDVFYWVSVTIGVCHTTLRHGIRLVSKGWDRVGRRAASGSSLRTLPGSFLKYRMAHTLPSFFSQGVSEWW